MGFLSKNSNMIAGGLLGAVIMFMTGGSGILGMLLPILGMLIGGIMGDKNGLLSGISNSLFGKEGQDQGQEQDKGQGLEKKRDKETPAPSMPQLVVGEGASVPLKKDDKAISTIGADGNPVYAAMTGTPPRGPEISLVEREEATGTGTPGAAYRYTGFVREDTFVVTSMAAVVPGSNPPQFGAAQQFNTEKGSEELALDIINGDIKLTVASTSPLAKFRTEAKARAASFDETVLVDIDGPAVGTDGKPQPAKATLESYEMGGKTYVTSLEGKRSASGQVTFTKATVAELTKDADGNNTFTQVTQSDIAISGGEVNGEEKVSLKKGPLDALRAQMAADAAGIQQRDAQMLADRGNALVDAINKAPTAGESLNALSPQLSKQLQAAGMDEAPATLVGNNVANYYRESDYRTGAFNAAQFRQQLKDEVPPLTDAQLNSVTTEIGHHHGKIVAAINERPFAVAAAGTTPEKATGKDLTRTSAAAPAASGPVAPPASPSRPAPTAGAAAPGL